MSKLDEVKVLGAGLALLTLIPLLRGQTSAQCSFNQLCQCKYAPNIHNGEVTNAVYDGQFGAFSTTSLYDDFYRSHNSSGRQYGSRTSGLKPVQNNENVREISCVGVPFARMPDFPVPYVRHLDVVSSGLEVLDSDILASSSAVESARLMNNKLTYVDENAFRSNFAHSLKSLDLSYNQLIELPIKALGKLSALDWLNLHSNQISSLPVLGGSTNLYATLSTLFLGDNDLIDLNGFLVPFQRLLWVNLDKNHLKTVLPNTLPKSLITLSLGSNLIGQFPTAMMDSLPSLSWLNLRDNYIETIPSNPLRYPKRLDKLDIGENFLTSIPQNAFNGSLIINDLTIDYNYIEVIRDSNFKVMQPRRIYLGHNRISVIHENAFAGIENILELVDLERNQLTNVSSAFQNLTQLRYLYLPDNNIEELPPHTFAKFCGSLRALSVSGNRIAKFPRSALVYCKTLAHLNIGYNDITSIHHDDFLGWAANLDTLILRNNRLRELGPRAFRKCPKLRELSLSFNSFEFIDGQALADVGGTLESLEISFGLKLTKFPEAVIRPLEKLLWLSLDNNKERIISEISETALYNLGELQYLNLDSNRLKFIPHNLVHQNVHKQLLDVRMAYNEIEFVRSGTFSALPRIQTVVLTGNKIQRIDTHAFRHLPNLVTLVLTHNKIDVVEPRAFVHLDNLQKLELQFNELTEFSLNSFENCTKYPMHPMSLNVSYNRLVQLTPMSSNRVPIIDTVDISHNQISRIPRAFIEFLSPSLRKLDISYNQLMEVERGSFKQLYLLQSLSLSHNKIIDLSKPAFHGLTSLQILDLSYNRIEVLQFAQFAGLSGLRVVDLSHNHLRSLPRDVLQGTSLEEANLSHNEFVAMPTSSLTEASATLRRLDLSHNRIEHVDSTMFSNTPHLISLSMADNRLTILPDNIFIGLGASLVDLNLSRNPIRANYKELFHYVQKLRRLGLSSVDTEAVQPLPLPNLVDLDLSANKLSDLPRFSDILSESLPQLRMLNISRNRFTHLPAHSWHFMPLMKSLDISLNPIRVLTKESFEGLDRLQVLRVRHLPDLTRFDADSLVQLAYLTELYIQSWPTIEKFKFRLGSVVSGMASLRKLSALILEYNGVLYDQIIGAFGPKLRELEITGPVRRLALDAFEDIESYEMLLTIRDTELKQIPDGFMKMFRNVAHFSLDLRNNQLERLHPEMLYPVNGSDWEHTGTKILQGGLALQGNPWRCSCENVWLGRWLRRWMRETLQLHTSGVERGQAIQNIVRTIECTDPEHPEIRMPLVELDEDVKCYQEMPVSTTSRVASVPAVTILAACAVNLLIR